MKEQKDDYHEAKWLKFEMDDYIGLGVDEIEVLSQDVWFCEEWFCYFIVNYWFEKIIIEHLPNQELREVVNFSILGFDLECSKSTTCRGLVAGGNFICVQETEGT